MQPPAPGLYIEAAVAVEQAKGTLLRDDPAKPKIARRIIGNLG